MSFPVKQLFRFDDFELNSNTRQLLRNGAPVALSPKGFEVLIYLVSNPGRLWKRAACRSRFLYCARP